MTGGAVKAAKPTKGDGRGGREENEKKRAQDMPQHVSNSRYAFFLLSFFFFILYLLIFKDKLRP